MKKLAARTKFIISKTPVAFSRRIRNTKNPMGTAIFFLRKREHSRKKSNEQDKENKIIMYILEGGMKKIKTTHCTKKQTIASHLIHDFDLFDAIAV